MEPPKPTWREFSYLKKEQYGAEGLNPLGNCRGTFKDYNILTITSSTFRSPTSRLRPPNQTSRDQYLHQHNNWYDSNMPFHPTTSVYRKKLSSYNGAIYFIHLPDLLRRREPSKTLKKINQKLRGETIPTEKENSSMLIM